ncbi:3282_t:CDS:2, partial [Paraglomus brasilianum]
QQLACQAGLEILKQGGNAADAAVAVAAALNVTEPASTGIGGDCFCLYYDATTKHVSALNGSGRSPKNLTLSHVRKSISDQNAYHIPFTNINAVTVPGAAAGWVDTIEWFGSGRVGLTDILRPAIELAEHGFGVAEISAKMWQENEHLLRTCSAHGVDMLLDGRAPRAGEIMRMPKLARTFRELAEKGKDGFYKGRIAEAIVELIQSKGGVMTLEDLAEHSSTRVEPISIDYKGVRVWECPPNGQGLTALMALGILSQLQSKGKIPPLSEMRHNSGEYLHAIIESLRLAFADTRYYVSDPEVVHVPVEELLSE